MNQQSYDILVITAAIKSLFSEKIKMRFGIFDSQKERGVGGAKRRDVLQMLTRREIGRNRLTIRPRLPPPRLASACPTLTIGPVILDCVSDRPIGGHLTSPNTPRASASLSSTDFVWAFSLLKYISTMWIIRPLPSPHHTSGPPPFPASPFHSFLQR